MPPYSHAAGNRGFLPVETLLWQNVDKLSTKVKKPAKATLVSKPAEPKASPKASKSNIDILVED